jgi:hypothetical protein
MTRRVQVTGGLDILDSLYTGYAEKPDQQKIHNKGNAYIRENFPKLDFIEHCRVEDEGVNIEEGAKEGDVVIEAEEKKGEVPRLGEHLVANN